MTQPAAQASRQFPNLFELIGRLGGLAAAESWCRPAVGIDEVFDGVPAPAIGSDEQIDQVTAIGSDEGGAPAVSGDEVIGQDEFGGPAVAFELQATSICSDEAIGQDEVPPGVAWRLDEASICSDEITQQNEAAPTGNFR